MSQQVWPVLVWMGIAFVIIGVAAFIWGRKEEKGYYDSITDRTDVREFMNHWPQHPQFGALKVGGWISTSLGVLMLVAGGAFYLWG